MLRWELTEWSVEDAKLSAHVELDPWADYAMRCERDGGPAAGPGIGCVLRGELSVDGELVQPFGAFVEPAELAGRGSFVRVVLVRAEELERRRARAGLDPPVSRRDARLLVERWSCSRSRSLPRSPAAAPTTPTMPPRRRRPP